MKHYSHFGIVSDALLRNAPRIREMIANIDRSIRILDVDIATEEERAQASNPSDPAYPILARMLAARRDNLEATAANLKQHLLEKGGALLLEEFNNL